MWLLCCCDSIPTVSCSNCENNISPECWEFAISGVTSGDCAECDRFNRTYTLQGAGCQWKTPENFARCSDAVEIGGDSAEGILIVTIDGTERTWLLRIRIVADNSFEVGCEGTVTEVARYELVEDTTAMGYDPDCMRDFTLDSVAPFTDCQVCYVANGCCNDFPSSVTISPASCP